MIQYGVPPTELTTHQETGHLVGFVKKPGTSRRTRAVNYFASLGIFMCHGHRGNKNHCIKNKMAVSIHVY